MRHQSAAEAKGRQCAGRNIGGCCQLAPREGTKLRQLYDLFMANKGLPIDVPITLFCKHAYTRIEALRDYYGLDIRRLSNGRWVLAGEWFGRTYVDYIADRLAKADRR